MSDTKNTGDKTISVAPKKTLGLKRGVERDVVRQSFSHGRTNTVQVERKKRRINLPGEGRVEAPPASPPPRPVAAAEPAMQATPVKSAADRAAASARAAGLVLRQLSTDELDARARALADAKVHEAEERRAAIDN
ncbi:MAG: translation initiation factor IF-2 associated domain-containing protein, partial [Bauldia sp.]